MTKKNFLYIEDNEQNYYLVQYLLTTRGHAISWAIDGKEGISLAVKMNPDIILLDIQLPQMDGYTVARLLREHDKLALTPIVAITSYAMPGDKEKALESGCTGYITKPINPETFVQDVESFLNNAV